MNRRKRPITYFDEIVNHPSLGYGIYTIPDVSRILRLPQNKVRKWLHEFWNNRFAHNSRRKYSWGEGRDLAVSFLTLIEFYTFFQLREHGVSAQKVQLAHNTISNALKTPYPFATSKILTDGRSVLFSPDINSIINADQTLQYNLKEIIIQFCVKIDFNNNYLAQKFFPDGRNSSVVIDPHHQFGQPIIEKTNVPVKTLFNFHQGGEKIHSICSLYDLSEKQVKDALKYYSEAA
jgi:uncharacterized protein (DUF433 family)